MVVIETPTTWCDRRYFHLVTHLITLERDYLKVKVSVAEEFDINAYEARLSPYFNRWRHACARAMPSIQNT